MRTDEIRAAFLAFFGERGCKRVASDSLVPANDPTLLFTGAGMNQFKDYFLGVGKMDFRRATSCQKCMRTGDIMNVGVTPSHHTMFEMLGNFSFGDYFKPEAIEWAWEFLTGAMQIPESKLQVSVHTSDDEAFGIWKHTIGLPESRIQRLGDHDNFWPADAPQLGPNGPCGPCSEIFFDRGDTFGPDNGITGEGYRWVEIWNLVFTQYERKDGGQLDPLPQKNIDTGMGLERMASCLQGTPNNMEIDIFQPLTAAIAEMAGTAYGKTSENDVRIRRIADHARCVTFVIGDGVLPANSHRGYVLKRLLRRAVLDGRTLGIDGAFLHRLASVVAQVMEGGYPDLPARAEGIAETIQLEEEKFLGTLDKGLTRIDMAVEAAQQSGSTTLDGQTAFELYDTYGFPYELAEEVVTARGLTVDRNGFEAAMAAAKAKAREGAKMKGDVFAKGPLTELKAVVAETAFLGYDESRCDATVLGIIRGDSLVEKATAGDEVTVVLDRSVFYGESGGQVGDAGTLAGAGDLEVEVLDTQKADGLLLHVGTVASGTLTKAQAVTAAIDTARRDAIRRNHTVTHLLHAALREVVGPKAEQKGSYVAEDRMRFDFQHGKALTREERAQVEARVNDWILENHRVRTDLLTIDEARAQGAVALFGEKYGDTVRMVSCGNVSKELCGGTHARQTAEIGSFRIVADDSVAAGVRRIEGVTGRGAFRLAQEQAGVLEELTKELKVAGPELVARVQMLLEESKALKKDLAALKTAQVQAQLQDIPTQTVGDAELAVLDLGELGGKELAAAADHVKKQLGDNGVAVLAGVSEGKVGVVVTVGPALAPKRLKAGDLVKDLAKLVGGGGGGRPDMAQAGGKDPSKLGAMLAKAPELVSEKLSQ